MKLIPIGITPEKKNILHGIKASDFSDKLYDGVQLRRTDKGTPVIIMHCKRDDPMRWKVVYGFSTVFFESFQAAVDFCNSRGMEIMKGQVEE